MDDIDLNFDELFSIFAIDAAEDIAAIEMGLLALEEKPDDVETRREILRHAHTLKGNASIVGLQGLTAFAHAYEERLEHLENVDSSLIALMLSGVDVFRRLVERDELTEADQELIAKLRDGGAAADSAAKAAPAEARREGRKHIRVGAEKLNRMLDLAGEIAIARGRVQQILGTPGSVAVDALIEVERQIDQLQGELQEVIMRARMVPVGTLFRQYARTVRDVAASHGKNAKLTTIGDDVEIDTTAVELLRDPLTHMIRNAIDHGIEPSAVRVAKGKPAVGHVTLAAKHEAGTITIRVSDDGAGLDRAAVGNDASVIFQPGFTTAKEVTDLSGRGVGMDVVRRAVEALRGTISIETHEGVGTTFTIRIPLTLAVIDGFAVAAGNETWIVPMENVVECLELPSGKPRHERTGVILLRDEVVPWVRVSRLFDDEPLMRSSEGREAIVVVQHDGMRAGLVVDELFGARQAVIKPLGDYIAEVPGIAGSSILGDGRVALILDPATILRNLNHQEVA